MLKSLQIKNFRMLDDFVVPRLGRVNLIVGRNNSGKSTVLEALHILAARGNPRVLQQMLEGHDETSLIENEASEVGDEGVYTAFRHLFPKRRFPLDDNLAISIGSQNSVFLKIEHVLYRMEIESTQSEGNQPLERKERRVLIQKSSPDAFSESQSQAIRVTVGDVTGDTRSAIVDLDGRGARMGLRRYPAWDAGFISELPCSIVPTSFIFPDELAELWDRVALTSFEYRILDALKVIEPDISGIAFIKAKEVVRSPGRRELSTRMAVVKLSDSDERIPLNSMGDGMLHVLQLALSIFSAKDGYLLIDEFENGLHWKVQDKVWQLLFSLAQDLNIQIFATTHSMDCVRSFAQVAKDQGKDEGVLFKVSRSRLSSDSGKVIATVYDANELETAVANDLEVR